MNYVIRCRYQYISSCGIVWTDWYVWDCNYNTEDEANEKLKEARQNTIITDKKTKLKHEYEKYPVEKYEADVKKFKEDLEAAKADFATIKKMKKPWAAAARKERKRLLEMSNEDKVQYLATKRATE